MYLLYSLLLTVGFLAMLPWFVIDACRTRKYITGLSQRLGRLPAIVSDTRPLIWLHCVSVGETEAARYQIRCEPRLWVAGRCPRASVQWGRDCLPGLLYSDRGHI